ncbi:MAG: molybdopterin-dependent oxidoreductase [Gammaproteobacteria bacterium]|nr:molybdopterin-dependent oxidoreductase [Gammaproteobacteria bacterium]MBT8108087.1 molybdopterin-dependent oxidoreductase [Gammaproteobacteria bacterium]
MRKLRMTLNGSPVAIDVHESRYLSEVLRGELGLHGTKVGCNEAECGICTVLVNGTPVSSCVYPAFKAHGAVVETIENLSADGSLHPLQQAFLDQGAVQCGICTPGMIMTAKALIDDKGASLTEDDIRTALKDTYCRCTGYASIVRAILQAARGARDARHVETTDSSVGRPLPNPNARAKIDGSARFTDDYDFPGMLYARTKRAGVPHARILSIDTDAARELPGVHAVLTHTDVPGHNRHGLVIDDWPVLCDDKVRYAGDAVAIVAAESAEIAAAAIDLINLKYEELPVVADALEAAEPEAPLVHEDRGDDNVLKHIRVDRGDIDTGFADADVVVDRTFRTQCAEHLFLEPECSIGIPAGYDPAKFGGAIDEAAVRGETARHDKTTIYVGSQIPYQDRDQAAAALGVEPEAVRVVATLTGGGFGGKEDITGQIHVALLAEQTGQPVKMLYSRQESLLVHPKRHPTVIRIRIGARSDGTLTAVQATLYGDAGAYASLSEKVLTRATTHAAGPYEAAHVKIDCFAMYTNNAPSGAFRGFGVTQSCFAVESSMDILAGELGIDAVELRRSNALDVGRTTSTGQVLRESAGLRECIEKVESDMRGEDFRWSWTEGDSRFAWGMAVAYKNTGLGGGAPDKASAEVEVWRGDETRAEVRISSAEMGQNLPGVLAACAAEELGMPVQNVNVLLGDTDYCPDGGPTTASRQSFVSGNAVRLAARKAAADDAQHVLVRYDYEAPQTRPLGEGGDMHFAFSFCAQAALVEVDMTTGEVHVRKVVAAHDIGRALNPLTLRGQIEGGIVMALGYTLTEHYIQENGKPWTSLMARYKMPSITHAPEVVSHVVEHPVSAGPFGAKGAGELPSIPTTAAITNAIYRATGVRVHSLPVDQDELLRACKAGADTVELGWGDLEPLPQVALGGER